jgi:hypothetical protein
VQNGVERAGAEAVTMLAEFIDQPQAIDGFLSSVMEDV